MVCLQPANTLYALAFRRVVCEHVDIEWRTAFGRPTITQVPYMPERQRASNDSSCTPVQALVLLTRPAAYMFLRRSAHFAKSAGLNMNASQLMSEATAHLIVLTSLRGWQWKARGCILVLAQRRHAHGPQAPGARRHYSPLGVVGKVVGGLDDDGHHADDAVLDHLDQVADPVSHGLQTMQAVVSTAMSKRAWLDMRPSQPNHRRPHAPARRCPPPAGRSTHSMQTTQCERRKSNGGPHSACVRSPHEPVLLSPLPPG